MLRPILFAIAVFAIVSPAPGAPVPVPELAGNWPDRPMAMKDVRVIALVQNDKTGEIVQAAQIDLEGVTAGGGQ